MVVPPERALPARATTVAPHQPPWWSRDPHSSAGMKRVGRDHSPGRLGPGSSRFTFESKPSGDARQRVWSAPSTQRARAARGQRGSAADNGRNLSAALEIVEGTSHIVRREREEEGGHRVGAGLGVALHPFGRQLVEVRAHSDAQLRPAAPDLCELFVELGQSGRQLLGRAVEGVPALPVARRPAQRRLVSPPTWIGGGCCTGLGYISQAGRRRHRL